MLSVTMAARNRLLWKLNRKRAEEDIALRFTRRKTGWRLRLDRAHPDDTAFTHEGRNVLLADEAVSHALTNATLDVNDTEAGPRLTLRRNQPMERS